MPEGRPSALRLELGVLSVGLLSWVAALVVGAIGVPASGLLPVDLYPLYGTAAFLGWLSGNGFVWRSRGRRAQRHLLRTAWLVAPPGLFVLLWSLAPLEVRSSAPLAPLWAWGVFLVFFLVPVSFRRRS